MHGGGRSGVAHEALRMCGMLAPARRAAVHHARGATLLSAVLRRLLRGVLRRVRRACRRRPGADDARGAALARHREVLRLPHVPRQLARPPLSTATRRHLLLDSMFQRRTADAVRFLRTWTFRCRKTAPSSAAETSAFAEFPKSNAAERTLAAYRCRLRTERVHVSGDASAASSPTAPAARLPQPRSSASRHTAGTVDDRTPNTTDTDLRNQRRVVRGLEAAAPRGSAGGGDAGTLDVDAGADAGRREISQKGTWRQNCKILR